MIRIKKEAAGAHALHTTGLHQHLCDFQMFYVLNGWIKFVYDGQGEHTFHAGDCVSALGHQLGSPAPSDRLLSTRSAAGAAGRSGVWRRRRSV